MTYPRIMQFILRRCTKHMILSSVQWGTVGGLWMMKRKEESLPVCKAVKWSGCKVTCLKIDLPSLILCKWRKFYLCYHIVQIQVGRALLKEKITRSLTCLFTICGKFNITANMSRFITVSGSGSMSRMRSNMYCIYCQIEITVCWRHVLQKLWYFHF